MANFPKALPHGSPIPVTDGIFALRGGFNMGPGIKIPRTMTVIDVTSRTNRRFAMT